MVARSEVVQGHGSMDVGDSKGVSDVVLSANEMHAASLL